MPTTGAINASDASRFLIEISIKDNKGNTYKFREDEEKANAEALHDSNILVTPNVIMKANSVEELLQMLRSGLRCKNANTNEKEDSKSIEYEISGELLESCTSFVKLVARVLKTPLTDEEIQKAIYQNKTFSADEFREKLCSSHTNDEIDALLNTSPVTILKDYFVFLTDSDMNIIANYVKTLLIDCLPNIDRMLIDKEIEQDIENIQKLPMPMCLNSFSSDLSKVFFTQPLVDVFWVQEDEPDANALYLFEEDFSAFCKEIKTKIADTSSITKIELVRKYYAYGEGASCWLYTQHGAGGCFWFLQPGIYTNDVAYIAKIHQIVNDYTIGSREKRQDACSRLKKIFAHADDFSIESALRSGKVWPSNFMGTIPKVKISYSNIFRNIEDAMWCMASGKISKNDEAIETVSIDMMKKSVKSDAVYILHSNSEH